MAYLDLIQQIPAFVPVACIKAKIGKPHLDLTDSCFQVAEVD